MPTIAAVLSPANAFGTLALSQKLRRRWRFFAWYLIAQAHSRKIHRLPPVLAEAFNHPWVAGVELKIRFWPGNETKVGRLWRIYKSLPTQSMHWDAPITVTVFRERRGKKRQALCMSFYVARGVLHIAQIQGVWKTDVPKELRAWPKIFIEACRTFAQRENLRAVMVPKAATLYSYRNPFLRTDFLPLARQNALSRIRDSMTTLYDKNAVELGFVPDGDWFRSDCVKRRTRKDESAATAVEYGLIVAGVALAIITAVKGIGAKLNTTFSSISTQLK